MPRKKKEAPNRSDGRYEVKITVGHDINGKPIRKSFFSKTSKEDARAQADEYKNNKAVAGILGQPFVSQKATFREVAAKWLEFKKSAQIKNYTYQTTYKTKIDKYIEPFFGNAALSNIRPMDVEEFFNKYSHLSISMREKFKIILNGIFEMAIANDLCYKNPVKNITVSGKSRSKKRVYSKSDADKLYKYCVKNNIVDISILLKTGIRRSELLGLKWSDIDTKNALVRICRAVTPDDGAPTEDKTKSESSDRTIPIGRELNSFLKSNKGKGYIVTGTSRFMSPSGYAKRFKTEMQRICAELKIIQLTPHELRHTFGTLLRESGSDIYTIQKAMGHSTVDTTAKIYVKNDIEVLRKDMGLENKNKKYKFSRVPTIR